MKSGRLPKPEKTIRTATVRIGTAGWSIPKQYADDFPHSGSHLERYARVFSAVEINSSFYRPHLPSTYARWAAAVPEDFRFAVKMPRTVTHELALDLDGASALLDRFFGEISHLGKKLGPILVQLPPSRRFLPKTVRAFFRDLRTRTDTAIVCEPRHASWFENDADSLLAEHRVARVAADPAPVRSAAQPGGGRGFTYFRLHGSPRIYYSSYDAVALAAAERHLRSECAAGNEAWCIFDNTAAFAATGNALALHSRF